MPHTPGPWFLFGNDHCVGGPTNDPEQPTAGIAMCAMRLRTPQETTANARLIAAAPDLLASLEEFVCYRGGANNPIEDQYVMDRAEAVIAKAKGQS